MHLEVSPGPAMLHVVIGCLSHRAGPHIYLARHRLYRHARRFWLSGSKHANHLDQAPFSRHLFVFSGDRDVYWRNGGLCLILNLFAACDCWCARWRHESEHGRHSPKVTSPRPSIEFVAQRGNSVTHSVKVSACGMNSSDRRKASCALDKQQMQTKG